MTALLTMSVVVEPDRQRLARLVGEAVRALGGNLFTIAPRLEGLMAAVRGSCERIQGMVNVSLCLEGRELVARCGSQRMGLCRLLELPCDNDLDRLAQALQRASEVADPSLLLARNRAIGDELERAKERAARELAELERDLEQKKVELLESLRRAETDGLTGLLNRAAYDRRLYESVARASRQGEPLTLALLDLDYFKQINDTHGHQYGDDYLRRMAGVMRANTRADVDHLCRYGGDEFAIIIHAPLVIAERVAQQVLQAMAGQVSIGVAQLAPGEGADDLVMRADGALYQAKRRGRGRVSSAAPPIIGLECAV